MQKAFLFKRMPIPLDSKQVRFKAKLSAEYYIVLKMEQT